MPVNVKIGGFHYFYTVLLAVLTAYADSEKLRDESLGFSVYSDYMRVLESEQLPAVILYPPSFAPEDEKSSQRKFFSYKADFEIELVTKGAELTDEPKIVADQKAVERLLILTQQVLDCVWALQNSDFGRDIGEISSKTFPSFSPYVTAEQLGEYITVGGRLTFSLGLSWTPDEPVRAPLERISINGTILNLEYNYQEET